MANHALPLWKRRQVCFIFGHVTQERVHGAPFCDRLGIPKGECWRCGVARIHPIRDGIVGWSAIAVVVFAWYWVIAGVVHHFEIEIDQPVMKKIPR